MIVAVPVTVVLALVAKVTCVALCQLRIVVDNLAPAGPQPDAEIDSPTQAARNGLGGVAGCVRMADPLVHVPVVDNVGLVPADPKPA